MQDSVLDLYPSDLLQKIVPYAGPFSLIHPLSNPSKLNTNLRNAINEEICKTGYRYDTQLVWPDYMKVIHNSDFRSANEFRVFDNYCTHQGLKVEGRIISKLVCVTNFIELQQLLASLHLSRSCKLALELDFTGWRYESINLSELIESIKHINYRITTLSIKTATRTSVKGEIDLELFKNLEVLRLNGCKFRGALCHPLRELSLDTTVDLNLPLSLKSLEINDYNGIDINIGENCPSLTQLSFKCGEPLPEYVKTILSLMTGKDTTTIKYSQMGDDNVDMFLVLVAEVAKAKGFTLKTLSIEGPLEGSPAVYPVEELEFRYSENEQLISLLQFPPSLKRLAIVGQNNVNFKALFDMLPTTLQSLDLSSVMGGWEGANKDLSKFEKLNYLNLSSTWVQDISDFVFPEALEELVLECNSIYTIEQVVFPKRLKVLNMNLNQIERIQTDNFPPSLQRLSVENNFIKSIDLSNHNLEQLLATCLATETLQCLKVDKVRYLKLENCRLPPSNFNNLTALQLVNCYDIDNISFENLSNLKELELFSNGLSEIPAGIFQLELRYLGLSNNKLKTVQLNLNTSLEILDLSCNQIDEFYLLESENKLKYLNLGSNELKEISIDFTPLKTLLELDISGNLLNQDQIIKLIPEIPQSTRCLFADRFDSTGGKSGCMDYLL